MQKTVIIYPALIYKNHRNNAYVANCLMKKVLGFGKSEAEAIYNLENLLNKDSCDYPIKIMPKHIFIDSLEKDNLKKNLL